MSEAERSTVVRAAEAGLVRLDRCAIARRCEVSEATVRRALSGVRTGAGVLRVCEVLGLVPAPANDSSL